MDYVTRQFINLAKKLRRDLRDGLTVLHRDLEKYAKAINKQVERKRHNQQAQNELLKPPIRVNAETSETEAAQRESRTRHNRNLGVQVVLTVGTWGAFLAAAYYAGIAKGQLGETIRARSDTERAIKVADRSAKAAENALDDSRQNFRDANRPYVWLDIGLAPPAGAPRTPASVGSWLDYDGKALTWSFHYRNYGKSPAINLRTNRFVEVGPDAWQKVRWHEVEGAGDVLPPDTGGWVTAVSRDISANEYQTAHDTFRNIVVFGHMEYEGLDGTSYWSEYCFFHGNGVAIENCPSHNIIK